MGLPAEVTVAISASSSFFDRVLKEPLTAYKNEFKHSCRSAGVLI